MSDLPAARTRDRSPPFPYIGLARAVDRLRQFYDKARRHEVYMMDAAIDWGFQPKSSSLFQTVGALLGFGLIEDSGSGFDRKIRVSDLGWRILEDHRPGIREKLMSEAALRPKLIGEMVAEWDFSRPDDNHAKSQLKVEKGFTDDAATKFLKVYDETIAFVIPSKINASQAEVAQSWDNQQHKQALTALAPQSTVSDVPAVAVASSGVVAHSLAPSEGGEREWGRGPISKATSYRLLVSGEFNAKEIGKLIIILEAQKGILEDDD